jgi:hypothetical protein
LHGRVTDDRRLRTQLLGFLAGALAVVPPFLVLRLCRRDWQRAVVFAVWAAGMMPFAGGVETMLSPAREVAVGRQPPNLVVPLLLGAVVSSGTLLLAQLVMERRRRTATKPPIDT